jgi:hypothetical protein
MARQFINAIVVATVALGCVVVVGATVAWSNVAGPIGDQAYLTKADFDQAFADAALSEKAAPNRDKLRIAGQKRLNGGRFLQSFWVAAIASPYLRSTDATLLVPLNHMPALRAGAVPFDMQDL